MSCTNHSALGRGIAFAPAHSTHTTHLLVGLEDVAPEGVVWDLPGDVAEDLEVLRVVRHVEYPTEGKEGRLVSL